MFSVWTEGIPLQAELHGKKETEVPFLPACPAQGRVMLQRKLNSPFAGGRH